MSGCLHCRRRCGGLILMYVKLPLEGSRGSKTIFSHYMVVFLLHSKSSSQESERFFFYYAQISETAQIKMMNHVKIREIIQKLNSHMVGADEGGHKYIKRVTHVQIKDIISITDSFCVRNTCFVQKIHQKRRRMM